MQVRVSEVPVTPGEQFCLPVTLSQAAELSSFEAGFIWMSTRLAYVGIEGGVLGGPDDFVAPPPMPPMEGFTTVAWAGSSALPVAAGDVLFELCFEATGPIGSTALVEFSSNLFPLVLRDGAGEAIAAKGLAGAAFIMGGAEPETVKLMAASAEANTGQSICLDVSVADFRDVLSIQLAMRWDTALLQFEELLESDSLVPPGILQVHDGILGGEGFLSFAWLKMDMGSGLDLPDGSVLFTLCFKAGTQAGPAEVRFSGVPLPIELTNGDELLPFSFANGVIEVEEPEVWPGDTDFNGVVDHFDLLNIGLGFGSAGPARPDATLLWEAQPGPGWPEFTPLSDVNYKHLDTDGDGLIDAADTLAISINWGEEVVFLSPPEEEARSGGPAVYVQPDTVELGEPAIFDIMLGEPEGETETVYGIGFSILYDTSAVEPGSVYTSYFNSWIGTAGENLIGISKDFYEYGRVDVAVTRTDGIDVSGAGAIAQLHITIQDVIFFWPQDYELLFSVENIHLIRSDEEEVPVQGRTTVSLAQDEAVRTAEPGALGFQLRVFPNPARDWLHLQVEGAALRQARLRSADGQVLSVTEAHRLPVSHLPSGLYFLDVWTDKGRTSTRVAIVK